jgi:hypothetical protein
LISSAGIFDPRWLAAPMSKPEFRLWRWLLGEERLAKLRREIRGAMTFQHERWPFGPGSGGAGGSVGTGTLMQAVKKDEGGGTWTQTEDPGNRYPHLYPTFDYQAVDKYGTVALPAIGAGFTVIGNNASSLLPFVVPNGFNGFIKVIANDFVANGGAAWTPGVIPQQLAFEILRDTNPVVDYGNFSYSAGTVVSPTPIAGFPIKEGETVSMLVSNLGIVVTTQFVEARLQGYYYGKQLEPKEMWQT